MKRGPLVLGVLIGLSELLYITADLTEEGKHNMDLLSSTNAVFKDDIESVAKETALLIERLAETSQFSDTIRVVSSHSYLSGQARR